jgi:hypothetical protein
MVPPGRGRGGEIVIKGANGVGEGLVHMGTEGWV